MQIDKPHFNFSIQKNHAKEVNTITRSTNHHFLAPFDYSVYKLHISDQFEKFNNEELYVYLNYVS